MTQQVPGHVKAVLPDRLRQKNLLQGILELPWLGRVEIIALRCVHLSDGLVAEGLLGLGIPSCLRAGKYGSSNARFLVFVLLRGHCI